MSLGYYTFMVFILDHIWSLFDYNHTIWKTCSKKPLFVSTSVTDASKDCK